MITFKIGSVTGNGYKEVNLGKVSLWSEGNKEVTKDYKMVTLATSRIFWSKINIFSNLCFKRFSMFLRSFSYQTFGRR